jgi:hypothetical protein
MRRSRADAPSASLSEGLVAMQGVCRIRGPPDREGGIALLVSLDAG